DDSLVERKTHIGYLVAAVLFARAGIAGPLASEFAVHHSQQPASAASALLYYFCGIHTGHCSSIAPPLQSHCGSTGRACRGSARLLSLRCQGRVRRAQGRLRPIRRTPLGGSRSNLVRCFGRWLAGALACDRPRTVALAPGWRSDNASRRPCRMGPRPTEGRPFPSCELGQVPLVGSPACWRRTSRLTLSASTQLRC